MKYFVFFLSFALSYTALFSQTNNFNNWEVKQVGNTKIYTPPNLEKREHYNITLFNAESIGQVTQKDWFLNFVNKNEKNLGTITWRSRITQGELGILTKVIKFKNVVGKKFDYVANSNKSVYETQFANYLSIQLDAQKVGVMRVNYSNMTVFKRYSYAFKNVTAMMRKQGNDSYIAKKVIANNKEKARSAEIDEKKDTQKKRIVNENKRKETEKERKELEIQRKIRTVPNKGLKSSQVEAITYHMDYYNTAYGPERYYENYLLLKDGWAYDTPTVPPTSFNVVASKKAEPKKWRKWRRNGKSYQIQNRKGGWDNVDGVKIKSAKPNQTLDANLSFTSSWGAFGVAGGSSTKRIKLMKNGLFESSFSSLNMGGDGQGGSVVAHKTEDKDGERGGASGTSGYGTKSKTNKLGSDKTGTYKLNGYTLELHHDNGKISQLLFGFTYGTDKWIFIDGTNYRNNNYKK